MKPCSQCGATVRQVWTTYGGRILIDPDPDPSGALVLRGDTVYLPPEGEIPNGENRYLSHYDTCPRRRRRDE